MRRIQERKDIIVALLATEFRRLSNLQSSDNIDNNLIENSVKSRDELIDMAFEELQKKDLDELTIVQLRHELQTSLEDQLVRLFQAFGQVDASLPPFNPDPSSLSSSTETTTQTPFETILQEELEYTRAELENPKRQLAPKGPDPKLFLKIKLGALQTLQSRRSQATLPKVEENSSPPPPPPLNELNDAAATTTTTNEKKNEYWIEADDFGYHETIDDETNQLVRYYQMINLCRSARLRQKWGYSVVALQSCIPGAGRGVYVDGFAKAGSILAFQPGPVWPKEHHLNMTLDEERDFQNNDNYQVSLRPDDHLIDSRNSPYTVLVDMNSNPMALGHVVNHPTPTLSPNCKCIMINFVKDMNIDARYIPNTYAKPPTLTMMGSLWEKQAVDMHGMCLLATRDVCNEELFYDYRLMTSHLPRWYTPVTDTHFVEADPNAAATTTAVTTAEDGIEPQKA
jgi:hypothetical protein